MLLTLKQKMTDHNTKLDQYADNEYVTGEYVSDYGTSYNISMEPVKLVGYYDGGGLPNATYGGKLSRSFKISLSDKLEYVNEKAEAWFEDLDVLLTDIERELAGEGKPSSCIVGRTNQVVKITLELATTTNDEVVMRPNIEIEPITGETRSYKLDLSRAELYKQIKHKHYLVTAYGRLKAFKPKGKTAIYITYDINQIHFSEIRYNIAGHLQSSLVSLGFV